MRNKPLDLVSLVKAIDLPPECLSFLGKDRAVNVLKKHIEEFKELVRQQRRLLALKHHPDKGGDGERMKEINDICDLLCKLEAVPHRPPPVVFSFHRSFTFTATTNTWTTSW